MVSSRNGPVFVLQILNKELLMDEKKIILLFRNTFSPKNNCVLNILGVHYYRVSERIFEYATNIYKKLNTVYSRKLDQLSCIE